MAKVTMTWPKGDVKKMGERVRKVDPAMVKLIAGQFLYAADESEAYMKENAPWTDRTGNARAGLHATTNSTDNAAELILAHSVYYGLFLEVCNSGKYGIIYPTLQFAGNNIMRRLNSMMAKLEGLR